MKKIYQIPTLEIVQLNGGAVCQSLIIGSGQSSTGSGNGVDLVKGDRGSRSSRQDYNVWNDDWSQ